MGIADRLIQSSDRLSSCVSIEKCSLRGDCYTISSPSLAGDLLDLWNECKQFASDRLSSEMRNSDIRKASQSCKEVTVFATDILKSQIDDRLKIALFKDLNIVGCMFDRSTNNYRMCIKSLTAFLDQIEKFKESLSQSDLAIWNQSTYGGEKQVPLFRSHLQDVMRSN